jgi:DNA ligase-1
MLATPQENATDAAATLGGRAFGAEDKLDGIRAQVHKSVLRIALYTRTLDRADASFPDVASAIGRLPGEFLLDGEIVPYRDGCVLPFAHIQRRLGRKILSPEVLAENPCIFIAFDILYKDGRLLMDEPLRVRREALKALSSQLEVDGGAVDDGADDGGACVDGAVVGGAVVGGAVVGGALVGSGASERTSEGASTGAALVTTHITPVSTADEIEAAFDRARACRNEGLVLKDPESPYSPGRRGQAWLKLKTHLPTLDCVVTAAEYGHGKRRQSLSDYTFAVWDRDPAEPGATLVNVGKAYSGVTDEEIRQLTELFHQLSLRRVGHVHIVRPQVVMEIACDQIQRSTRHASGYALRFPRIKRIRWDKAAEDADRLQRVIEIYQSATNFARGEHSPTGDGESPQPVSRGKRRRGADPSQLSLFE